MARMGISGTLSRRTAALTVAAVLLLAGCGGSDHDDADRAGDKAKGGSDGRGARDTVGDGGGPRGGSAKQPANRASPPAVSTRIPDVGDTLHSRIPDRSRQVLAVYGEGENSARATAVLYVKRGENWHRDRSWAAHNGRRGWTVDHEENDLRSPVGVFTLSDAGGVLPDPGARLPYDADAAFAAPRYWPKTYWNDFDYVIAIDYNRVRGTSPLDPTRPRGQREGGGIWLHLDHGSGTSACVSLPKSGMEYLLKTLDPERHPVVVMGDKAHLAD
ncbi:hypothetical protein [Streptomyces sp. SAJ15]|uniref:hypothetical protein n=1 Tax=Streptomyces sp. SAJ15 TaxID=2011095 RepID=UPI001185C1FB|nr:hypothetical protein [Streptomyces sp. SAJ15]TVL89603.1 hypothetical protein CD790_27430 [Streptomyces sp. SAJ15]